MCGGDVNIIMIVCSFDAWTNVWQFLDNIKCPQILDCLIKTTYLHFCTQRRQTSRTWFLNVLKRLRHVY